MHPATSTGSTAAMLILMLMTVSFLSGDVRAIVLRLPCHVRRGLSASGLANHKAMFP